MLPSVAGRILAVSLLSLGWVTGAHAQSISTVYDMTRLLNEPHPFTPQTQGYQPTAFPTAPAPRPRPVTAPRVRRAAASPKPAMPKADGQEPPAESQSYQWLSEIRGGVLKHAMSMIGNTTKETGIDANVEVLFGSPGWMEWAFSPRPHIGGSFNSSDTNTDIGYAGLTWEWQPWDWLFLDFSFGFAVHNGALAFDAHGVFPENAGRRREFGCRWLFRETLEAGWKFLDHHALSIMWSHYSHGGLCADQNEGLDNLGVRYGYRF